MVKRGKCNLELGNFIILNHVGTIMDLHLFSNTAIEAVKKAGELLIINYRQSTTFNTKSDKSIVTKIDNLSNETILNVIAKSFPDHQILSEESGIKTNDSDYLWVIDPLDGTSNYFRQIPFFCISIALVYKNELILGVIYNPLENNLYKALKGEGSFLNDEKITLDSINLDMTQFLSLIYSRDPNHKKLSDCIFYSLNPPEYRIRNFGAAALELAYTATNKLSGLIILGNNPWDIYAGILLIQEAGGLVTDINNKEWNFDSENVLAGHPSMHSQIFKTIEKCL